MNIDQLKRLISTCNIPANEKERIIKWVNGLPTESAKPKPSKNKVGDVYFHQQFNHPYVLLEHRGDEWTCILLTSDESCLEILEKCNSRFFSKAYFTKVLFTTTGDPTGLYLNVFDNPTQVKRVLTTIKKYFI